METAVQKKKFDFKGLVSRLARDERSSPIALLIIAVVFLMITTPDTFLTYMNLRNVIRYASFYIIVGIGTMIVFMAGEMDMSCGSIMGMGGIIAAYMAQAHMNVALIMLVVILIGFACGLLNGVFVGYWGLPAMVATLGVQKALRGIITVITQGYAVNNMSEEFMWLGGGSVGLVPVPIIICVIICVITWYLINKTTMGRHMIATGNNRQAATVAGINTKWVKCFAYIYSGILASITGAVLAARLQSGQTTLGNGFELDAIAGAIIGGASLGTGGGSVSGTVCGILFIYIVKNGMQLLGVNTYWQNTVQGLILVLAVLIDVVRRGFNSKTKKA